MADKITDIYIGATSMSTCLGDKTETIDAMRNGKSGLCYNKAFAMYAGVLDEVSIDGYTRFESMIIEQIEKIVLNSGISMSDESTGLIISTTKGNVELLADNCEDISPRAFLYTTAKVIAQKFGCVNAPIVVSNACISGVSALILARDMLLSGEYKNVVVAGCDVLCEFITSGFTSFKSISANPCRPYDVERDGLTLGEAVGAVLLTTDCSLAEEPLIRLTGGAITNDANHISGPSRTGDGLYYAISQAMNEASVDCSDVGFINLHGTATRYNDEMECKAVALAALDKIPSNSVKGYIGHTLGASGIIESIICIEELKQEYIFGTKGLHNPDPTYPIQVSAERQPIYKYKQCCIKTASGFGGCNAAIVLNIGEKQGRNNKHKVRKAKVATEYTLPQSSLPFAEYIRNEFRLLGESNMKFYKMSDMCKALYVAVENLLKNDDWNGIVPRRRAIILSNRSASLDADIAHQHILNQHLSEGVSPAVFVYTLANVAIGEMCIRHKIQGENTFLIEDSYSEFTEHYAESLIERDLADAVICGWCEYLKGNWDIHIKLLKNE